MKRLGDLLYDLREELVRLGGGGSREEMEVVEQLSQQLATMEETLEAFTRGRRKVEGEAGGGEGTLLVDNIRHVLKTEEDVFNYFIR